MADSSTIPGKGKIKFEAGDTLKRTITIKSGGVVVNLSAATIEMLISTTQDGEPVATLTVGDGLIASNLSAGEFKIFWQSGEILLPNKTSYYKIRITFPDGTIRTYLEDELKTV